MPLQIEVPATIANLGSGYDTLGVAVTLGNGFTFVRGPWSVDGVPTAPDRHLVLQTVRDVQRMLGAPEVSMGLTTTERVPRSRGLGSSATARVAGLLAGIATSGMDLPVSDRLRWLERAEGHPDNAWPALLGGLVICGGCARPWPVHPGLRIAACIPAVEVDTPLARAALPATVAHRDAVATVRALGSLLVGLGTGDPDALLEGVRDRLHQPWRAPLIGPVSTAFARAEAAGGAPFVGGSGSTLAAWVAGDVDPRAVADALASAFRDRGTPCTTTVLEVDTRGATLAGTPDPPAS